MLCFGWDHYHNALSTHKMMCCSLAATVGPHLKHLPALWNFPGDSGHLGKADEVKVTWICEVTLHVCQNITMCL